MAENKTSFVLYSDSKSIIDLLSNEQAGLLLKTLFAYVNDENPIIDSSIALVFEMIKLQLKRDLKKWEKTKEGRSTAGKASAEARRLAKLNEQISTNPTNVDFVQQTPTNPTVSVNDNVSVSVSVSGNEINKENKNNVFFAELIISDEWLNTTGMQAPNKYKSVQVKTLLKKYNDQINSSFDFKENKKEYCRHFVNWINKQPKISGPTNKGTYS
jgi:hypothetical protein